MKSLLNFFVDLCLLRTTPQDLPGSGFLLKLTLVLHLLVGVVMFADASTGLFIAFLQSAFETVLMLIALYFALTWFKKSSRFLQTATALMGSGFLLGLLALPLVSWNQHTKSSEAALILLLLIIWSIVVTGHILRHSFDTKLSFGVGVTLMYTLISTILSSILFPVAA